MEIPLGYERLVCEFSGLLYSCPPPFIYVNDPATLPITSSVVRSVMSDGSSPIRYAHVDAVACFTARLLYDSVLNALARWHPKWFEGCLNWGEGQRWNENLDGFMHGLRAVASENNERLVVVIDHAERIRETLPSLVVPLTRLAELVRASSRC